MKYINIYTKDKNNLLKYMFFFSYDFIKNKYMNINKIYLQIFIQITLFE